jgi:hypothetical protein
VFRTRVRLKRVRNVYLIPGVSNPLVPRDEQPVPGVIAELEDLLADARSGKLRAFAAAVVNAGEYTTHCWARGAGQHAHHQAAAISDLAHAYAADRHKRRQYTSARPDGAA